MSKSNYLETSFLRYLYENITPTFSGDSIYYVALHVADPGEAGTQSTNETTYPGYARVAVSRSSGGWTTTGDTVRNVSLIQFPTCNAAASLTITHFSIGRASSGAGDILHKGALDSPLPVAQNIRPEFSANALAITED